MLLCKGCKNFRTPLLFKPMLRHSPGLKFSPAPSDDFRSKLLYTQECESKSAPQLPDQRISSVRVLLSYLAPSSVFRTNEFRTSELPGALNFVHPSFDHSWAKPHYSLTGKFPCSISATNSSSVTLNPFSHFCEKPDRRNTNS